MYNLFNVGKLPEIVKEIIAGIFVLFVIVGGVLYFGKQFLEAFAKVIFM